MKRKVAALLAAMLFSQTGITAAAQLPNNYGTASVAVSAVIDDSSESSASEEQTEFLTDSIEGEDNSEELFDGYVERTLMGISDTVQYASSARASLNEYEKEAYDYFIEQIKMIADGRLCSTQMTCTFSQPIPVEGTFSSLVDVRTAFLNTKFSYRKVVCALLADCPYELYWFNKPVGYSYNCGKYLYDYDNSVSQYTNCSVQSFILKLNVNGSFADTNEAFMTDQSKTSAASKAAVNASEVIELYSGYPDADKLTAFKKYICDAVSYDYAAAEASKEAEAKGEKLASYDSWQLIYVFDGDPDTNVVCEGYSKAFKLLCDMSEFKNDIYAVCVTGSMTAFGNMSGHMWNIVSVNGRNYLADITNSDSGTIGEYGGLFMSGMQGEYLDCYYSSDCSYIYDSDTLNIFSADELAIESEDFDPSDISGSAAIDPPGDIKASADHVNERVTITWASVSDAVGYKVFLAYSPDDKPVFDGYVSNNTCIYERNISADEKDKEIYFCVRACSDFAESKYSEKVKVKIITLPTAPASVSAIYDAASEYVVLMWDSVANASVYHIYRTADPEKPKELIADDVTDVLYIDRNVEPSHTYYYYIAAKNTEINYCSDLSSSAASAEVPAKLSAPGSIKHNFCEASEKLVLSWDAPEGAESFNIYRAESLTDAKVLIGSSFTASYDDDSFFCDKDNYYYVTACSSDASESDFSEPHRVNIPSRPAATVIKSVDSTSDSVTLTWTSVKNAEYYVVYRGVGSEADAVKITQTDKLTYTDTSVSGGNTYYYRICTGNSYYTDTSKFAYSEFVSVTMPSSGEISSPKITDTVMGSSGMYIYWDKVPGASCYYVYRADSPSGTKTLITETASLNCLDKGVSLGKTYYYFLQAYNSSSSERSSYSPARRAAAAVLSAPGITDAAVGDAGLYLYWNSVPDATSYRIYRSDSSTGTKTVLAVVPGTNYIDKTAESGRTYYYYVTAFSSKTNIRSAYSVPRKVTVTKMRSPSLTDTCVGDAGLYLYWNSVPDATSYRIYRADTLTGAKQLILVTASLNGIDKTAVAGRTYYYFIAAFNNLTMIRSAYSAHRRVTVTKLSSPSLTDTCLGDAGLYLYWSSVPDATSYRIFRADALTGEKQLILVTASLNGIDTTAVTGKTYYYFIAAFNNRTMIRSAYSASRRVVMTKLNSPAVRSASASESGVTITWNAVSGATSYRVYRSDTLTGAKTLLTVQADTAFTDTTAVSGRTYFYFVSAFSNKTNIRSAMSGSRSVAA